MSKLPSPLSRNSLHYKFLRIVAYSLAVAISLSGATLVILSNLNARETSTNYLTVVGEILAEKTAFQLGLGSGFAEEAENTLSAAKHHEDIAHVCLYDNAGMLFAQYQAAGAPLTCKILFDEQKNSSKSGRGLGSSVVMPVTFDNEQLGHIVVESNGIQLGNTLVVMTIAIVGTLSLALLLAFILGSRLVSRSLIPLKQLAETGVAIAKNPYAKERATKQDDDEIGDLVDTFNAMLDALSSENQKLSKSENTFRSLTENAPVGVFLRATPTSFSYVNSCWESITGISAEQSPTFSEHISSEFKRTYIENIAKLKSQKDFVSVEFEFIRPSGEYRFLQESISVIREGKDTYFVGTLLDLTELKNSQNELERLAYYDPLTKLPNRRFLADHLSFTFAAAEKKEEKIAVFMTDLDNFKRVNDSLGHDAGDALLVRIAKRLRDSVFREDVVVRMGGDEFLIVVEGIENLNSVEFISKRLLNAMEAQASLEFSTIPVTGSIGVAMYPDDARTADELLRFADMALYNSKENGGNNFSCYSSKLNDAIHEQIHLEQKLRLALEHGIIDVFIQPQYAAKTEKACWAEALVRWCDKDEGFISPAKFIPIAEESGLIHELGDYVLDKVCEILSQERANLHQMDIKGISVNLSAKQFFSDNLDKDIQQALAKYGVSPNEIEFELTESTVTDNMEQAITIMERIRALGCRLSIDDFGTGYSSLSYLKRFPITSLKIDRSFVNEIPGNSSDCEITCAIINLAHNLGMTVVAEGVETKAQAEFLAKNGCEYLQGYYYTRPFSVKELVHRKKNTEITNIKSK